VKRVFLILWLVAAMALQASAQTILGRHPADTVTPQFYLQNSNALTTARALNSGSVALSNLDLSATAEPAAWATNSSGSNGLASVTVSNTTASVLLCGTGTLTASVFQSVTNAVAYDEAGLAPGILLTVILTGTGQTGSPLSVSLAQSAGGAVLLYDEGTNSGVLSYDP
jgi:hypothetical protein